MVLPLPQRLRTVKNNHLEITPLQTLLFTEQDDTMLTVQHSDKKDIAIWRSLDHHHSCNDTKGSGNVHY